MYGGGGDKSQHGSRIAAAAVVLALALCFALAAVSTARVGGRPTISGNPEVGQTLTSSSAGGSGVYKWESCDPAKATSCGDAPAGDGNWVHIAGANEQGYTVTEADRGHYIRVVAKGTSLGESPSSSLPVGPVPVLSLDLSLGMSDSADPVQTGGALTYTIDVTNNGSGTATGVGVNDLLPEGTSFTGASPGCSEAAGAVTCDLGSIVGAATATVTISVTAPATGGTISNTATVDGDQPDPQPNNDSDSEQTTVNAPPTQGPPANGLEPDHGSDFLINDTGGGPVLIKLPGSKTFVPVQNVRDVPFGSTVKAEGVATITSERGDGTKDTAAFWGGTFTALQSPDANSYFVAKLRSRLHCGGAKKGGVASKAARGAPIATAAASGRLWGSGHGQFRSRGRGGAATLRGTTWWWKDRCSGTEFGVTDGTGIDVEDPGRKGLVFLQPGDRYFAKI